MPDSNVRWLENQRSPLPYLHFTTRRAKMDIDNLIQVRAKQALCRWLLYPKYMRKAEKTQWNKGSLLAPQEALPNPTGLVLQQFCREIAVHALYGISGPAIKQQGPPCSGP
jgi:hypothetical protein